MGETKIDAVNKSDVKKSPNAKLEKQKKIEELKLKVKHLREERMAKHAARVEMLKKKYQEKYADAKNISSSAKNISACDANIILKEKSNINTITRVKNDSSTTLKYRNEKIKNSTSETFKENKDTSLLSKAKVESTPKVQPNVFNKNHKYDNIPKKVDTRRPSMFNNTSKKTVSTNTDSSKTDLSVSVLGNRIAPTVPKIVNNAVKGNLNTSKSVKPVNGRGDFHHNSNINKTSVSSSANNFSKGNSSITQDNAKRVTLKEPMEHKRWSMASVNRLSKPKLIFNPDAQKHVNDSKNRKPATNMSGIKGGKSIGRRSEIPQKNDKSEFKQLTHLRRSLSTVHFKRMGSEAAKQCLQRTLSVGNMKNKEIEDDVANVFPKGYVLPVESERKKSVKFLTPIRKSSTPSLFLSTPNPSDLKQRLNSWLQKRGKSLSSYHHLHCFGIHNIKGDSIENRLSSVPKDDENKENEEVLDDDSFEEISTGEVKDIAADWRRASYQLDSPAVSKGSPDLPLKQLSTEYTDSTGTGALDDLHHLILEDYSWQQCAEWLRAIVQRCGDKITNTASYWECRASLEEKRGDFPRAVECYNKAIIQGAQPVDVEVSLDHLLQKFMKLNLDPEHNSHQVADPKFLDVKNVFKSTLIRFAIQQKNIVESKRLSSGLLSKYVATPVRRSSRLSRISDVPPIGTLEKPVHIGRASHAKPPVQNVKDKQTPKAQSPLKLASARKSTGRKHLVQLTSTLQNVNDEIKNSLVFVPNKALNFNDC